MTNDTQHRVTESADKIRVQTKVKRGTGTRDQDVLDVKVKGDDPADVVERLNETVALLEETADDVRAIQPGEDDA